jgi:glycosyltransferase involved in cell wall biosynthesis
MGRDVTALPEPRSESPRKLLVLDTSYTFEAIRERGLEATIECRDLRGFFEHVWTVHPFATLLTSNAWAPRFGRPTTYRLSPVHTVIEGKVGRFHWLKWLFALNFLLGQIGLFLMLSRLIRNEGISAIRCGNPLYLGLFGWALSRTCNIPFVVRVGMNNDKIYETTGTPMEPRLMRNRKIEKIVERFVFRRADLVAGANQDNLDFALANGANPEKATIFRYGNLIDARHFTDPEGRPVNEEMLGRLDVERGKFILYIGRLEAPKHADDVVRVLARLRSDGLQVKAVLAGDGRLRPELERLAADLGIAASVVFAGNCTQEQLSHLVPAAAAVVSPHTGRALAEAALGAAPIVAYDIDWQSELIETDVTGVLVRHRDWNAMAEAAARFIADRSYAQTMGSALRERAIAMLDPLILDQHEQQQYRRLLAHQR